MRTSRLFALLIVWRWLKCVAGWGTSKRAVPIHLESDEVRVADHHSPGSGQLVDSLELTESVQMTDAEARKHGSPYHAQYKRTLY